MDKQSAETSLDFFGYYKNKDEEGLIILQKRLASFIPILDAEAEILCRALGTWRSQI